MATNTPKLNLPKPEGTDYFNRTNYNELVDAVDNNAVGQKEKGAASGVAPLDSNKKVPLTHLPKVDDSDKVDGKHFSDIQADAQTKANAAELAAINFAKSYGLGDTSKLMSSGTDLNTINETGFYRGVALVNAPSPTATYFLLHLKATDTHKVQLLFTYNTNTIKAYQRTCNAGLWTNWEESETVAGSTAKADKAYNDAYQAMRDYGLGGIAKNVTDKDLNTVTETGFYQAYRYTNGAVANVISCFIVVKYSKDWITQIQIPIGNGNTQQMYTRTFYSGTTWSPWVMQETTIGAQIRADNALASAKSYVDNHTNRKDNPHAVTTQQVNVISVKPSTDLPDSYPIGVSIFSTDTPNSTGYPYSLGTVITNKISGVRCAQVFYAKEGATYFRTGSGDGLTWSTWKEYETTDGAQAKADVAKTNAVKDATDWVKGYGLGVNAPTLLSNLDTAFEAGFYQYDANSVGCPLGSHGAIIVAPRSNGRVAQLAFNAGGSTNVFIYSRTYAGTNGGWGSWVKIETEDGAQAKANVVQSNLTTHINDSVKHITSTERNNWNAKETPAGAQAKVNATQVFRLTEDDGSAKRYYDGDLNSLIEPGWTAYTTPALNKPDGDVGVVFVLRRNTSTHISQHAFKTAGLVTKMFIRHSNDTGVTWSSWSEMETTAGAQSKASSAETNAKNYAQGYAMNQVATGSSADPNTTQESYILTNNANAPSTSKYWHILTFFYSSKTNNKAQMAISYNESGRARMFIRQLFNSSWLNWTELTRDIDLDAVFTPLKATVDAHVGSRGNAHANASTTIDGFMSYQDKAKLDGIATGAEKNQASYGRVKAAGVQLSATGVQDTVEFVGGSGITAEISGTSGAPRVILSADSSVTKNADFAINRLWQGASFPNGSTTITPSKKLSECRNGWILLWSDYDPSPVSAPNDFHYVQSVIHKGQTQYPVGGGTLFKVPTGDNNAAVNSKIMVKGLVVSDSSVRGYDSNYEDSSPYANDACLRAIYEF
jgi:hypothetical protein